MYHTFSIKRLFFEIFHFGLILSRRSDRLLLFFHCSPVRSKHNSAYYAVSAIKVYRAEVYNADSVNIPIPADIIYSSIIEIVGKQ